LRLLNQQVFTQISDFKLKEVIMRPLLFSVLLPVGLIILGIILVLLGFHPGALLAAGGALWLIFAFFIEYKDNEKQPLGMGRGRKR
jgi:hypothetical protein